ncbi:MAG: DUF1648 domain-containing protein [Flavobacterium sp.]
MAANNPKLKIPFTTAARMAEVAGLLLLLSFWVYTLTYLPKLPDIIPTHFGAGGEVDGHGDKWTLVALPGIATILYVLMTLVARYPHKMNYLVEITPQNAFKQYSIVTGMFRVMKIAIVIVFFMIGFQTVQIAMGAPDFLGKWFMMILFALIFSPVFYFLIQSSKNA